MIKLLEIKLVLDNNEFDLGESMTSMYIQEEINTYPILYFSMQNNRDFIGVYNIQGGEKIEVSLTDEHENFQVTDWVINNIVAEYNENDVDARFKYEGIVMFTCIPSYIYYNNIKGKHFHKSNNENLSKTFKDLFKKFTNMLDDEMDIEDSVDKNSILFTDSFLDNITLCKNFAVSKNNTPYNMFIINTLGENKVKVYFKSMMEMYEKNSLPDKIKFLIFANENKESMIKVNKFINFFIITNSYIPKLLQIGNKIEDNNLVKNYQSINLDNGKISFVELSRPEVLQNDETSPIGFHVFQKNIETFYNNSNFNISNSNIAINSFMNSQVKYNKIVVNVTSKLSIHIGDIIKIEGVTDTKDRYLLKDFMVSKVKHIITKHEAITELEIFGLDINYSQMTTLTDKMGKIE